MEHLTSSRTAVDDPAAMEFWPGEYPGEELHNHSVFLREMAFEEISAPFYRHAPHFNPYGPTPLRRVHWRPIVEDLKVLASVHPAAGELAAWVTETLKQSDCITVLGP